MSNRLMMTVAAAALIAGTGFANAQGMSGHGGAAAGGAGGAGMQQSAPSSPSASPSGGAANHEESSSGMKSSQSEERGGAANRSAQQDTKSGTVGEKSMGEKSAQESSKGDHSKSMSSQNEKGAAGKDMKAEDQRHGNMKAEGQERDHNMKAEGREDRNNNRAEGREMNRDTNRAEGRENDRAAGARGEERSTVGQAGAGAKLTTEQRTKITTVIRDQHVSPVNNINFAISVGTRVPREVGFHPLPADIVTIYPDWRGYEFFLARDQIVVVDPRTLEIVAVLNA